MSIPRTSAMNLRYFDGSSAVFSLAHTSQVLVPGRVSAQRVPSTLGGEWKQEEQAIAFEMFIFALGCDAMSYLLSFIKP